MNYTSKTPFLLAALGLILVAFCQTGSIAQAHRQAFEDILAVMKRCGTHPGIDTLKELCLHSNYESLLFKKINYLVFCCTSVQFGDRQGECILDLISQDSTELDASIMTIQEEEVSLFHESQNKLLSFCNFLNQEHSEEMQNMMYNKLKDLALDQEKSKQQSIEMVKHIENSSRSFSVSMSGMLKQHKRKLKAMRMYKKMAEVAGKRLKQVRGELIEQRERGKQWKHFTLDYFLGNQTYLAFWMVYFFFHYFSKWEVFHDNSSGIFTRLLFSTMSNVVVEFAFRIGLVDDGSITTLVNIRLIFKCIILCYLMDYIRKTRGSRENYQRMKRLKDLQEYTKNYLRVFEKRRMEAGLKRMEKAAAAGCPGS